jgi:DNA-binding transcriptional regulator YdaS (Cro superfamily)
MAKIVRNMTPEAAARRAIEIAGGMRALARAIGIRHQGISKWTKVPATQALAVEKATGISRHVLRPDIYPRED